MYGATDRAHLPGSGSKYVEERELEWGLEGGGGGGGRRRTKRVRPPERPGGRQRDPETDSVCVGDRYTDR